MLDRTRRDLTTLAICWSGAVLLSSWAAGEQAERAKDGRWVSVAVRTMADLPGRFTGKVERSKYGGDLSGPRQKATGFFRTERGKDRWLLVDPEGCPFVSVGLCSVNLGKFPPGAAAAKFGSDRAWAEHTATMLKECGFNTLGRWTDAETFRKLDAPLAYTTTLSFMLSYAKSRPASTGDRGFPGGTVPVFDKEFPQHCDTYARTLAATKDDPWLLGHFSDNELPFRPEALDGYLRLAPTDPWHQAAVRWLASRHQDVGSATHADRQEFVAAVAELYFSTVARAIKKHDPNHLYLGSRLNGRNINEGTLRGSRPVDVVSINMYHYWSVNHDLMNRWATLAGRPILNSEWYAMSLAAPDTNVSGAGFRVRSDRDRGLFYQNLCLGMLSNPNCVGWHWFKYGGDGDNDKRGFVDRAFAPHAPMVEQMKQLNTQVYPLRKFLLP